MCTIYYFHTQNISDGFRLDPVSDFILISKYSSRVEYVYLKSRINWNTQDVDILFRIIRIATMNIYVIGVTSFNISSLATGGKAGSLSYISCFVLDIVWNDQCPYFDGCVWNFAGLEK